MNVLINYKLEQVYQDRWCNEMNILNMQKESGDELECFEEWMKRHGDEWTR